jgi:hypothetical protein
MQTWETAFVCTTIGLVVVIAIANAVFILLVGEDGTLKYASRRPPC